MREVLAEPQTKGHQGREDLLCSSPHAQLPGYAIINKQCLGCYHSYCFLPYLLKNFLFV